jgi:hypothetical protein
MADDASLSPGPLTAPSELSGSARLCLACGLCCSGVLSPAAPLLQPGDLTVATRARLRVIPEEGVFALPCPRLNGTRCETYIDRPAVCGTFRCALLARFEDQGGPIEPHLAAITRTKELLAFAESKGMSFAPGAERKMQASGADAYEMMSAVHELMQRLHTDFVGAEPLPDPLKFPAGATEG